VALGLLGSSFADSDGMGRASTSATRNLSQEAASILEPEVPAGACQGLLCRDIRSSPMGTGFTTPHILWHVGKKY
jgi:hypothetical protein